MVHCTRAGTTPSALRSWKRVLIPVNDRRSTTLPSHGRKLSGEACRPSIGEGIRWTQGAQSSWFQSQVCMTSRSRAKNWDA